MSYRKRPTGDSRAGPRTTVAEYLRTAVGRLRRHYRTWAGRYVEMRLDAGR
ncbi:hypothetical protein [Halorarius halobius]|uniref:hypothetical protein n=1 Tax=Halorarius halobius TaxID=2962671 RepID=UPI0020CED60B|nr:hypothetical protein [Halorarius halobius]